VNLRLSDEQHAELVNAGQRENRSLQREIIYRLFGRFNQEPATWKPAHTNADAESRDVSARMLKTDEVKPDFKPERKKK
jgi:hypothetical protein